MFIKKISKFRVFNQILFLAVISSLHPAVASLLDPPVVALSLTDCEKNYLVQIFESGKVEYRGGGVKTLGRREGQINQQELDSLIKKFNLADVISDDRESLPAMDPRLMVAIRIRYGNRDLTFLETGKASRGRFRTLQEEIIRTTKLKQWVTDPMRGLCMGKGHAVLTKNLKME
jgi:hypothetical protein